MQGSHGIPVTADCLFEDQDLGDGTVYVLPGGMPGTLHLGEHRELAGLLAEAKAKGAWLAAICAAPSVLGGLGLLEGETAACYPGFEEKLAGARVTFHPVEVSGHVITSRGMGTAIPFALKISGAAERERDSRQHRQRDHLGSARKIKFLLAFLKRLCYTSKMTVSMGYFIRPAARPVWFT